MNNPNWVKLEKKIRHFEIFLYSWNFHRKVKAFFFSYLLIFFVKFSLDIAFSFRVFIIAVESSVNSLKKATQNLYSEFFYTSWIKKQLQYFVLLPFYVNILVKLSRENCLNVQGLFARCKRDIRIIVIAATVSQTTIT